MAASPSSAPSLALVITHHRLDQIAAWHQGPRSPPNLSLRPLHLPQASISLELKKISNPAASFHSFAMA
jgi:hypothetical protein